MIPAAVAIFLTPQVLFGIACLLFLYYGTSTYGFWKRKNIKFKRPVFLLGNITQFVLLRKSFHECMHDLYVYFRDEPFGGFFQMRDPVLLIRDPDLVHTVLVRDFKHFVDHGLELINPDKELNPLSVHLFSSEGDQWRALRRKISPIFTSGKLKGMESQVFDCVNKLNGHLDNELKNHDGNLDLKSVFERLTIDVIGSCAFGIGCNSLEKNDQFTIHGRKVFDPTLITALRVLVGVFSKKLLRLLKLPDIPSETKSFFLNLVLDTMRHRRRNNVNRPDLLQLLMGLQNSYVQAENASEECQKNDASLTDEDKFDEIHIAANSFLFFVAGFETTASTLSYGLYELAINQNIQDRLRQEVEDAYNKHNQCLSIEMLNEVPYLDAVISETLRKYPPLPWLVRVVVEDWVIPNTDKVLPKGTHVIIPTWSIQHDWQHYPNPEIFDPQRFYGENATKIRNGTYVPFGEGPRQCVGTRFAKMEIKLALADFILKYEILPCTRTKIPLDYQGGAVMLTSREGVWIHVSKRKV